MARYPACASAATCASQVCMDSAKPCSISTSGASAGPTAKASNTKPGAVSILRRSIMANLLLRRGRPIRQRSHQGHAGHNVVEHHSAGGSASLRLDVGGADHLAPFLCFPDDQLAKAG